MPNSMINKDAREGHGSKKSLEHKWDEAKDASEKSTGKKDSWALTNYIYQKSKDASHKTKSSTGIGAAERLLADANSMYRSLPTT